MQIFGQENEFFMSFSSFFYKYTICQRSFRSLFKVPNDSTTLSFPLTRPSLTRSFNRSFVHSLIAHRFHPLIRVGHNYYLFLYYSFIFSSGIFFLPEQIRIQSFSVSLCRYDVLSLLNGTK